METQNTQESEKHIQNSIKESAIVNPKPPFFKSGLGKFIALLSTAIILLVAFTQLYFLFFERSVRFEAAQYEIASKWGDNVNIASFVYRYTDINGNPKFIYPKQQNIAIKAEVFTKNRGVFKFPVFILDVKVNASFDAIDFTDQYLATGKLIVLGTKNNIISMTDLNVNKQKVNYNTEKRRFENSMLEISNDQIKSKEPFNVNMIYNIQGSKLIALNMSRGRQKLTFESNWGDPIFTGEVLPDPKTVIISENSSSASFVKNNELNEFDSQKASKVNIEIKEIVNHYTLFQRSMKYAFLVIFLTLLVVIISEKLLNIVIHGGHYLLIGLALCMFYGLLLAMSEHLGFRLGYLISAFAIVLLITWYNISILSDKKLGIVNGVGLCVLYIIMFVLIQMETYAFLVGTILLFVILIGVMSLTKRWLK